MDYEKDERLRFVRRFSEYNMEKKNLFPFTTQEDFTSTNGNGGVSSGASEKPATVQT